jgi:quinol monooxygenase YgiN
MIVVIAKMHAREGKEDKLRDVLTALVVESRQEAGCVRYDLLVGEDDPGEFALYEAWENAAALNAHLRAKHVAVAHTFSDELTDVAPRVVSYSIVQPNRTAHSSGATRRLDS